MNIYRYSFQCNCPIDGKLITYTLKIRTDDIIHAEKIMKYDIKGPSMHEDIADNLYAKFGGEQILKGRHGSVDIETRRSVL